MQGKVRHKGEIFFIGKATFSTHSINDDTNDHFGICVNCINCTCTAFKRLACKNKNLRVKKNVWEFRIGVTFIDFWD